MVVKLEKTVFRKHVFVFWSLVKTWSDSSVRELATVCLPWQHWTKALVWFDDVIHINVSQLCC